MSSCSAGFRVRFNLSFWSGSSMMVGFQDICFIASRDNVFAWKSGWEESWYRLIFNGHCHHSNFPVTRYQWPIRCREHTQKQKQNPRMCLRPFTTESRWVRRVPTPKTKTRSWASRSSQEILVYEGAEKSREDLERFDLSRNFLATESDWRETMGDREPWFTTRSTR